jgi:MarR family transcriptional regulator, lower aerobic nicotinate degradation pathway regulator
MARGRKYVLDEQIGFLLRKANQRHRAIFSRMISPKLAPAQFAAMAKLRSDGPIHQNELGRLVAMDSATTTGVVNRLAQRGWVRSSSSADDARLRVIELTDEGNAVLDQLLPRAQAISAATLAPLTHEEAALLCELLRRIAEVPVED